MRPISFIKRLLRDNLGKLDELREYPKKFLLVVFGLVFMGLGMYSAVDWFNASPGLLLDSAYIFTGLAIRFLQKYAGICVIAMALCLIFRNARRRLIIWHCVA